MPTGRIRISSEVGECFAVNVYCKILTLVKSVFVAFVVGAVAGFLAATGNAAEPVAPASHGTAPVSVSAWVQR
jgi:hypothetical protein